MKTESECGWVDRAGLPPDYWSRFFLPLGGGTKGTKAQALNHLYVAGSATQMGVSIMRRDDFDWRMLGTFFWN